MIPFLNKKSNNSYIFERIHLIKHDQVRIIIFSFIESLLQCQSKTFLFKVTVRDSSDYIWRVESAGTLYRSRVKLPSMYVGRIAQFSQNQSVNQSINQPKLCSCKYFCQPFSYKYLTRINHRFKPQTKQTRIEVTLPRLKSVQ